MQYSPNEIIYPFWAENSGFMTGRDPLGIQNSSVATYSRLLPGMTNQTQRIRYYGFYCWLLNEYHNYEFKDIRKDLQHQFNFIRRAELLLAFMMVNRYPDEKAVVGSNHAVAHINDEIIKLKVGAEKKAGPKEYYWEYPSGALGQYYAGSLINLELVEVSNRFFHITEKGKQLASAFNENVPSVERNTFLELIQKDELAKDEIFKFPSFAINQISIGSEEWVFYKNLLTEISNQGSVLIDKISSRMRRDTIISYFEYIESNESALDFQTWSFVTKTQNDNPNSAKFGWYYYFICEAFHFSYEAIFWSMLVILEKKYYLVDDFIDTIKDEILKYSSEKLNISGDITLEDTILTLPDGDIVKTLKKLEKLCTSDINYSLAINDAIELILLLYGHISAEFGKIKEFENSNFLNFQNGNVSEFCNLLVTKNLNLRFPDFVEKLIMMIINDHTATAFRKMGDSETNLLKFMIEDNIISHAQTMSPVHTNPRLNTLKNMMQDLGFVKNNKITNEAKVLISELQN